MRQRYTIVLPIVLGMVGTAILCSYLSPWAVTMPDSATYLRMAEEIQKGYWHIDQWIRGVYSGPPLYPMLVALLEWVIPGFETAGTLVSILSATVAVIPLFFLARHFYNEKVAYLAVPLTILNPWYLEYMILPLTEALFTFLFVAGLYLILCAVTKNSSKLWLTVGVASGAAWMSRDAGIILPFLSFLWFAISIWKNEYLFSKIVRNGVALVLGIVLVYVPLKVVMTMDHKGIPDPPPDNSIAFQMMMPDLRDSMKREIYLGGLTADGTGYAFIEAQKNPPKLVDLLKHWDHIVRRLGHNFYEIVKSVWEVLGLVLLAVLVGILRGKDLDRQGPEGFPGGLLFLGSCVLSYLLFYALAGGFTGAVGPERYLVPLIPIWGIWAASGIFLLGKYMERFNVKHLGKLIILLFIGIIFISSLPGIRQIRQSNYEEIKWVELYKLLGTRLRGYGMNNMVIMARAPFLSYYAGASWVMMPYGEYPEIIKFARARHVDFLYMERGMAPLRPQLSFLLRSNGAVPEMERVYHMRHRGNPQYLAVVLYRIKY